MTVVFSPVAETDLEDIGDYIARANPRRAVTFVREIRDRCNAIAGAPEAACDEHRASVMSCLRAWVREAMTGRSGGR